MTDKESFRMASDAGAPEAFPTNTTAVSTRDKVVALVLGDNSNRSDGGDVRARKVAASLPETERYLTAQKAATALLFLEEDEANLSSSKEGHKNQESQSHSKLGTHQSTESPTISAETVDNHTSTLTKNAAPGYASVPDDKDNHDVEITKAGVNSAGAKGAATDDLVTMKGRGHDDAQGGDEQIPAPALRRCERNIFPQPQPGAVSVNESGSYLLQLGQLTTVPATASEQDLVAEVSPGVASNEPLRGSTSPEAAREVEDLESPSTLAEATPVYEDEGIVSAEPVDETSVRPGRGPKRAPGSKETIHERKMNRFLLVIFVAFAIGIIVALSLVFRAKNQSDQMVKPSAINATTIAPVSAPDRFVLAKSLGFPNHTMQSIASDSASAQARAYDWLLSHNESWLETVPQWKMVQRFALAVFYYALGGETWASNDGWLQHNLDECSEWFFRTVIASAPQMGKNVIFIHESEVNQSETIKSPCDGEGHFKVLAFSDNNLRGSLPFEVELLSSLEYFDVSANALIEGTIPSQIGLLTNLKRFFANRNFFTGSIPTEVGILRSLKMFDMGNNPLLSGPIPTEFGNLGSTLTIFSTQRSGVTGFVPTELFRLTNLEEYLIHQSLNMTGGSLEGIGNLTKLREFVAHDIPYQSTVPTEVGLLTNLLNFNLWNTKVHGTIPTELWNVTSILRIDIDDNFLSGTFPNELGQLSLLQTIYINGNKLTGTIPSGAWKHMPNLTVLNIGNNNGGNRLDGTLPSELGFLTSMTQFGINMMNISGTIPSELGSMTKLQKLFLHNSKISGTIPTELIALTDLELFTVSFTFLTGSIPAELCGVIKEVDMKCLSYWGVQGNICSGFEVKEFACSNSTLCGCNCTGCL